MRSTRIVLCRTVAVLPLVAAIACTRSQPEVPKASSSVSYVRGMSLPNDADGQVTFDTGKMRGTVTIHKDVPVGYRNVVTTSSGAEVTTSSKTTLTVKDKAVEIDEDRVRIGDTTLGPFSGDVRIEIRLDGIYVDGVKKADLGS